MTCDAHFQTRMRYSSQKSCVKMWLGLVEIGGMLILKGGWGRSPLLGGLHVTCNAHLRTWPSYSSQKSCVKIWFGLVEPFKSYRVHKHTNIQKEKITDATENYLSKKFFSRRIKKKKKNHRRISQQYPSEKFFSGRITKPQTQLKTIPSEKFFSGR